MKYCFGCIKEIKTPIPFRSGVYCSQACIDKFIAWEKDFMSKPVQEYSTTPLRKEAVDQILAAFNAPLSSEEE